MKTLKKVLFLLVLLFTHYIIYAQTCNGNTFNSPGAPSSCTYEYTSSGWNIIPPSNISDGDSVCILDDNATDFGTFRGDLFIADGATYSGNIGSFNSSSTIVVAGTASIGDSPPTAGNIYIEETGVYNAIDNNFSPTGIVYNAGTLNASNNVSLGGSAIVFNYNNATFNVQGDITISKPLSNCGLLEVQGDLSTTGSGGLSNGCSTWIHGDMTINSDYYNDNLIVLEGTINFNGADFYNNDILMVDNINLSGDDLIGNNETSVLIVRYNSTLTSGGSITGHYYYDMDDGGGVDSVCGTCTEDVDIVTIAIPNIPADLVADCGNNIIIEPPVTKSALDFDGIDDYAEQLNSTINGLDQYTISFWFKYEGPIISDNSQVFVMGQKGVFEAYISDWTDSENVNQTIGAYCYKSNGLAQGSGWRFDPTNWTHFTVTVDNSGSGTTFRIFRNGYGTYGSTIASSTTSNSNPFRIAIPNGSSPYNNFEGWIDEVKIFDSVLTDTQIQQMVYQEIKNNNGSIQGKVVPKNIEDFSTGATISWNTLQAYYPMTNIISETRTDDYSGNSNALKLYNITTFQPQTAPMPYETASDGKWSKKNTWVHGDVWDIESLDSEYGSSNQNPEQWSIVEIHHDVTTSSNRMGYGLFIDPDKTLTSIGDVSITNDWYLQLDGTLDLDGDSQLIQTETSDMVTSAEGKVLRRQEGNTSIYWYNYWSSPVGAQAVTTISDNNAPTNNTNNTPYSLNMLKDGSGNSMQFTNAFDEPGKISTYWLYTFQNGVTYYDWDQITPSSTIQPGFGYTQKGTGNAGTEQQYIFEGKPNNGTILVAADDVDGDNGILTESIEGTTLTTTLIGNPYPSALDAVQFINDNKPGTGNGTISGTILLWEQWAGTSHYLAEYQGGYGYINTLTTERAYQYSNIPIVDNNGDGNITIEDGQGIKTPTFNIPVGQGFFVEVIEDGDIQFNNGQRVFAKESDADAVNPNNGSMFFRTSESQATNNNSEENEFQLVRLEFATSEGSTRRFVLGFGEDATEGYDYGLDGGAVTDLPEDDMGSLLNGQQYVIQAFSPITDDKEIDINLNASGNFNYSIKAVELSNIPEGQEIYLRDNLTNTYFDLKSEAAYNFTSEAGLYTDRFDVVFKTGETLATKDLTNDNALIYVNQLEDMLYVKALTKKAKQLSLTNMLGQTIKRYNTIDNQTLENGISISDLSSGVYVVSVQTENNQTIDKKVIIN